MGHGESEVTEKAAQPAVTESAKALGGTIL